MRLFVAVALDEPIKKSLGAVQSELKSQYNIGTGVRWVEPANIHLTLRFLGEVDETTAREISAMLTEVCGSHPVFRMDVVGLGAFPNTKTPRVIWAGCKEPQSVLPGIYQDLESRLTVIGLPPDDHKFSAHITLGRVKSNSIDELGTAIEGKRDVIFGGQDIRAITLFKSTLTPTGPIYEVVNTYNLT